MRNFWDGWHPGRMGDIVSLEAAKILKELGFSEKVSHYYHSGKLEKSMCIYSWNSPSQDTLKIDIDNVLEDYNQIKGDYYSAPTVWEARDWIWRIYNKFINVTIENGGLFFWSIKGIIGKKTSGEDFYYTPKDALMAGIWEYLKKLRG